MTTASIEPAIAPPKIRQTKNLIDGRWVDSASGETFDTFNPATGEVIAQVSASDARDVDQAAAAARRALESGPWRTMSARQRGKLVMRLAELIEQNQHELAGLEVLNNGKPIQEVVGADIPLVINTFRYFAGWADKIGGRTIPVDQPGYFVYTQKEPVGVCGQIIPWNFPMLMAAWKWAPALIAGCTIILKPAEQTPLTALRLGELALEAGFPPGVINIINGFGETAGEAIVKHPGVDKIAFTGEYKTAQKIMTAAAPTLKRLTFELGGKSPNVVFADADLEQAVDGAMTGIFFNQGEVCCAGSRLLIERSVHDQFVERFCEKATARVLGDPFDPATEQGAQVSRQQYEKVLKYIEIGKQEATCVAGGESVGERGWFIRPTIFTGVNNDMRIAQEEIFGPVVAVMPFDDFDQAVCQSNQTMYGLAAAVWTRDLSKAHRLAQSIRAGTVWVNCYNTLDPAAPFGGYKYSGQGRECGQDALSHYTETKTVWINTN